MEVEEEDAVGAAVAGVADEWKLTTKKPGGSVATTKTLNQRDDNKVGKKGRNNGKRILFFSRRPERL